MTQMGQKNPSAPPMNQIATMKRLKITYVAAKLILEHRLFRSLATGDVINRSWLALHYPPYWHYDILQALLVLSRMGRRPIRGATTPTRSWSAAALPTDGGVPALLVV
jgi:hypothetical protein